MVKLEKVVVATAGTDGSATGSGRTEFAHAGRLLAVHLDYSAGQPGTTDVTIKEKETPQQTMLNIANNNTDGWYYPRVVVHDVAGADVTYDGTNEIYELFPFAGVLEISVAEADDAETVEVTIIWED